MFTLNRTDHDNDTVLTILEDLDGDHNFDNDDTRSLFIGFLLTGTALLPI